MEWYRIEDVGPVMAKIVRRTTNSVHTQADTTLHLSELRSTRLSLKMYVTTTSVVHATVERRVSTHTQKAWKGSQNMKREARMCEHLSNVEAKAKERVEAEAKAEEVHQTIDVFLPI